MIRENENRFGHCNRAVAKRKFALTSEHNFNLFELLIEKTGFDLLGVREKNNIKGRY